LTILNDCSRAETLAGAVALGEASNAERDAYRRHLSGCSRCISALGGERAIERTMETVARAREAERWEPDVRGALRDRERARRRTWRVALGVLAAAVIGVIGVHAVVADGVKRIGVTPANPIVVGYDGAKIVVERRAAQRAPVSVRPPAMSASGPHDLVVVHNIVTLRRPAVRPAPQAARADAHVRVATPTVGHRAAAGDGTSVVAEVGPSQRDRRSVAALRTAETAPPQAQRAESIAVIPSTVTIRDVIPLGGENAITPRPPSIAYAENAEGTTAFEVSVDERGAAVKCTITKASGYLVLDEAVCRAAMHARYSPRTINGRAVSSLYHDAFTFRSSSDP
jgi:TonB family protein